MASDSSAHNSDPQSPSSSPPAACGVSAQPILVGAEWTTRDIISQVPMCARHMFAIALVGYSCCSLQTSLRCRLQLSGYSAALALDFLVTLAVFPGISSAICSVKNEAVSFPCSATTPSGRFYGEFDLPYRRSLPWTHRCRNRRKKIFNFSAERLSNLTTHPMTAVTWLSLAQVICSSLSCFSCSTPATSLGAASPASDPGLHNRPARASSSCMRSAVRRCSWG